MNPFDGANALPLIAPYFPRVAFQGSSLSPVLLVPSMTLPLTLPVYCVLPA